MSDSTTHSKPTFTTQFELTLKITGSKLEDIDNGLIDAAGVRLRSRIQSKTIIEPSVGPVDLSGNAYSGGSVLRQTLR
jgi:hypothetical protein